MMTFRQWMMQMARQYGRHYVVALFMCCLLFPLLFSGYDIVRDTVIISSGFTVAVAIFQFRFLYQRNAAIFMMGVPLKRRQLFHYCWFSGWLALLPIAAINGGCAAADGMSGISAILASILYQTLNYAITVFFVSRSRRLLDAAKECRSRLVLHVYGRNLRAMAFYLREGFRCVAAGSDPDTGEREWEMAWR